MTRSRRTGTSTTLRPSGPVRLRPVAAACCSLLLGTGAVHAQQTSGETQTVVVTGIRGAIESSIATKRDATSIVEAISAEDIGKLPDLSIAESLARLPGLTAQRVDGRSQVISIRGMAPRYGATLLNNRELVSTGDNRSVEYDQFPSELVGSAVVYKTPDALLAGQGLSGTVNIKTVRPLDYRGRQVVVNARGEHNSNGSLNADTDANGMRFSASYIDQFADNTIGVALGFAHLDAPGQEKHYKSWWWANTGDWGSPLAGTPPDSVALQGFEQGVASTDRKRDGLMGVFEYRPTKDFRSTVDLYYSTFEQTEVRRTLMADLSTWAGVSYSGATTGVVDGTTVVTGGNLLNVNPVALNTFNHRKDDIKALGWNNELKLGEWTAEADLSYSKAHRSERNGELQAGAAGRVDFNGTTIATGSGVSMFTPSIDYANPGSILLRDPTGWGRDGRSQFPKVDDEQKSFRLSARRDFAGAISGIEGGVNYTERTKRMNRTEEYYFLKNGRTPTAVDADLLVSPADLSFAGNPNGVLSYDFLGAVGRYYDAQPAALDQGPGRIWDVQEKVTTAFARMSLDFAWKVPVTGNLGVQIINQKQRANGLTWNPTTQSTVATSGGASYTDILPSLNLAAELDATTKLRLGMARVMARPNMEDMRAGFSGLTVKGGGTDGDIPPITYRANGGNPGLEPWRANAFDISLEKYIDKRSYAALAYFHKDVRNFVYSQTIPYDFTGFPNPTEGTANPLTPTTNIGTLTTQANGDKGRIEGWELSTALDGATVSPMFNGFGVMFSLSRFSSSLHENNDTAKPLDGLSGMVRNLTVYYENHGWQVRVAQRSRTDFVTTVRGTFGENVPSAIMGEKIVDAQIGYSWDAGALKGLSVLFQVNNLNDSPYRTRVGISTGAADPDTTLPERYTTYGRQYLLGATYKF